MAELSFSKRAKRHLLEQPIKKKCCQRAFEAGMAGGMPPSSKCPGCSPAYLRGLFLCCGSVTDPQKRYHLELVFTDPGIRDSVENLLTQEGMEPKAGVSAGKYRIYFKESGAIEDFLVMIGAQTSAFELMNCKIVRDVKNDANRATNCDAANIAKSVSASNKYVRIIRELEQMGKLADLPVSLRETAKLRCQLDGASLGELGLRHQSPISKSGVIHRLEKICEFYESVKQK